MERALARTSLSLILIAKPIPSKVESVKVLLSVVTGRNPANLVCSGMWDLCVAKPSLNAEVA